MEKKLAEILSGQIDQWRESKASAFETDKLVLIGETLNNFHQWANKKPVIAGYKVTERNEDTFFVLLIDWHRNGNYYLVIYTANKTTTAAEIHRTVVNEEGQLALFWQYTPLKRDGLNAERKAYFKQVVGSASIEIALPQAPQDVEAFMTQLFALGRTRLRIDRSAEFFIS
jgi:glutamate synthase domain-containing protein 1